MAIVSYNHMGTLSESVSPSPSPSPILRSPSQSQTNSSDFLVSAIGIIGLSFWLLSEYIFFRQCCLSQRRGNNEDTLEPYSPMVKNPGLNEDAIISIPIVLHKEGGNGNGKLGSICECAVCLNEFQDNEKLRVIPICNHAFHIDCIDTWLRNNSNCPLCRKTISRSTKFQFNRIDDAPMQSSSLEAGAYMDEVSGGDEDFVVIEMDCSIPIEDYRQRMNSGESLAGHYLATSSPRDLEEKVVLERGKEFDKVTGIDDECIETRGRDDEFDIEPIGNDSSQLRRF